MPESSEGMPVDNKANVIQAPGGFPMTKGMLLDAVPMISGQTAMSGTYRKIAFSGTYFGSGKKRPVTIMVKSTDTLYYSKGTDAGLIPVVATDGEVAFPPSSVHQPIPVSELDASSATSNKGIGWLKASGTAVLDFYIIWA